MVVDGDYITSPIPNTTMLEKLRDGVLYKYAIQAANGYVLHDNRIDWLDEEDNTIPRFKFGSTAVPVSYDFDNVTNGTFTYADENGMEVIIPVEMIGEYEFYTLPASVVPENQT